ncbi:DUF4129 domain-containing protein [Cellulomonas shaoxiangyii]|uniref:DUF4129 domain-containing protein n=1 Tax=Cellulomonas shaoxiangyii TaxID=2566013 RepID=UPI001408B4E9|nr:DUF4129 domain-containing protein [Cellulomonas shaoxiangyii]
MPTTQRTPRPAAPPPARPAGRGDADRATVVTVLAGVLVVVAVLAAALAGPVRLASRGAPPPPPLPSLSALTPPPQPTSAPDRPVAEVTDPPEWLGPVVAVVLVVLAAAVLALVARWLLRRRWPGPPPPGDDDLGGAEGDVDETHVVTALRAGVSAAARALDDDVPPGDAVVAAWVAVEDAAASTGIVRDRAQTATEFTLDVLDGTRADPAATRALLVLYLEARFGAHPVTAADVQRARELLAVVGDGLARRADDAAGGAP